MTRATARGALSAEDIVVVDHNADCLVAQRLATDSYRGAPIRLERATWAEYLAQWMTADVHTLEHDAMVPSPLMPHLCLDWLMGRARTRWPERRIEVLPLPAPPPMPWERAAPDGRHYVSFATWMCPVNCIEPTTCPETRGERDWSMPPALRAFVDSHSAAIDQPLIFHCVHRAYGVGMIDAQSIRRADDVLDAWSGEGSLRLLVGTVSHCHGALGLLVIS